MANVNFPWKTWFNRGRTGNASPSTDKSGQDPSVAALGPASQPAGYLHNQQAGPQGRRGVAYDYITAANGVLVQAANDSLQARITVAEALQPIKGLQPAEDFVHLVNGPIPDQIMAEALGWVGEYDHERFLYIKWQDGEYRLVKPRQEGSSASVTYDRHTGAVLEVHSHGRMRAFFSATDNRDEQGFSLYGVLGTSPTGEKELALRIGIYGHFAPLDLDSIAAGGREDY